VATRLYFNVKSAPVAPSSWSAGWNTTSGTFNYALGDRDVAAGGVDIANGGTGTTSQYRALGRFVSAPLAAQTISGTVKGQVNARETNATDNYSLAIGIKVIQSGGSDRGAVLAVTAPDASGNELAITTSTNRSFRDSAESASISLSSLAVSDGDRIVVEVGFYQQSTSTANAFITLGDTHNVADLAENETTTTSLAAWVEFSQDLLFSDIFPREHYSIPTDNGTNATTGVTITPQTAMRTNDLVLVYCQSRASATWSVTTTGGQTWNDAGAIGAAGPYGRLYWCVFNGTWSANPVFTSTVGTATSAIMHSFCAPDTTGTWAVDNALATATFTAPSTPFTVTRTGVTTTGSIGVVLASWHTSEQYVPWADMDMLSPHCGHSS